MYCLPDRPFRDTLDRGVASLFAVDFRDRVRLVAERGSGVVDEVQRAIERSLFRVASQSSGVAFGQLEEVDPWFVTLAQGDTIRARELARQLEVAFDRDREHHEDRLPMTRLLCSEPIAFESRSNSIARAAAGLDKMRARSQQYPSSLPLALAIRDHELQTQPAQRAASLVRLHEVVVRWLSAILLCEASAMEAAGRIPELGAIFREDTEADWMAILEATGRMLRARAGHTLRFPALVRLLFDNEGLLTAPMSSLQAFSSAWHRWRTSSRGYGDHERPAQEWEQGILATCEQIGMALSGSEPLHVDSMQIDDDDDEAFVYQIRRLVGDYPIIDCSELASKQRMRPTWLYLFDRANDVSLALDPLVIVQRDPRTDEIELLFLEAADGARLEYRSLQKNRTIANESLGTAPRRRRVARLREMATSG